MTNRRDRLRRGLPCIGPARSLGRHADGGWWSFRSDAPASTESLFAIEAPRIRVHANLPRRTIRSWDRRWRSLTRCLPVSCVHVALRSGARCVLRASRTRVISTTGANRWMSPTSESPGATRTPSCLGSSAATSRTPEVVLAGGGRCALRRVPYVASIKSASETPTPLSRRPFRSALGSVKSSDCSGRR